MELEKKKCVDALKELDTGWPDNVAQDGQEESKETEPGYSAGSTKPVSSYPEGYPSQQTSVPSTIELSDRSAGSVRGGENMSPQEE